MRRAKLDDARLAEMRRLWSEGVPPPDLARRFGVEVYRVWGYCDPDRCWRCLRPGPARALAKAKADARESRQREAARRGAGREKLRMGLIERNGEILRLWWEGWLGREIGERFGINKASVSMIVAKELHRRRYGDPEDAAWPHPRRHYRASDRPVRTRPVPSAPAETLPPRPTPKGASNGRAKLSEADVERLKTLKAAGWSYPMLAREFGISRATVWYILSGTTWSHTANPPADGGRP